MLRIWLLGCFSFGYLDFPFQEQLRRVCCWLLISRVLYVLHTGAICIHADMCTVDVCVYVHSICDFVYVSAHVWRKSGQSVSSHLPACLIIRSFMGSTMGTCWATMFIFGLFGASWVFVFAGCWRLNLSSHASLISTFWGEGINEAISHVQLKHSFWKINYNQGAAS